MNVDSGVRLSGFGSQGGGWGSGLKKRSWSEQGQRDRRRRNEAGACWAEEEGGGKDSAWGLAGDWGRWEHPEMCSPGEEWVWGGNELSVGFDECESPCRMSMVGNDLPERLSESQRLMGKAVAVGAKCWEPL